jgi:hypothetical protein
MCHGALPWLGRFSREYWQALVQVMRSGPWLLHHGVGVCKELRCMCLVIGIANDAPEVHGCVGRVEHLFVFGR